jgi:hypothetical protein
LRRFQEIPRPLDAGDRLGHAVCDGESGLVTQIRIAIVDV